MVDYDGRHAGIAHANVPVTPSGYIYIFGIPVKCGKEMSPEQKT